MSLPSLNLSFEKHYATSMQSQNDNSARNSVVLNIINPVGGNPPPQSSPTIKLEPATTPRPVTPGGAFDDGISFDVPSPYNSPAFSDVEKEFKDQLLSFTTDLLLNDIDIIKNMSQIGDKILLHVEQLKKLIAILYLSKEDRPKWDELIVIDTEKVQVSNCLSCVLPSCKSCSNPFYEEIKHIFINNSVNFLTTPYSVNMTTTFRISLQHCLTTKMS